MKVYNMKTNLRIHSKRIIQIAFIWLYLLISWITNAAADPVNPKVTSTITPVITKKVFDNGLILLVKPNPANEVVSINVLTRMGRIYEPQTQLGISKLMQRVLVKGTTTRSARDIVFETEAAGASIEGNIVDYSYGNVSLKTTLAGFDTGLNVLLDILQNPGFPPNEVAKEKQLILQDLASIEDQPVNSVYLNFLDLFYRDHPIGIPSPEVAQKVMRLSRDDLLAWYRKIYVPNNIVISIVGNVSVEKIVNQFTDTLGAWPKGKELLPIATTLAKPERDRQVIKTRNSQAIFMIIGYPAPALTDVDHPVMNIISYILGGDMGSRLFMELREKNGLAYNVSTEYYPAVYPSNIFGFMATAPENFPTAQAGIIAEFRKLTSELVPENELRDAKQALKGIFLMSHETNSEQAKLLGGFEIKGAGYQYDQNYPQMIDQVTAADIRRVAQKYFKYFIMSVVSPVELKI